MVCLDSDVLINFLRNDIKTIRLLEKLREDGEKLATTSINSFELLKGIPKSSRMSKSSMFEFLSNFKIYNFDLSSSEKAAEIFGYLKSKGEIIELPDILIAAIAITNNEKIMTKNIIHFKRIGELKVLDN